MRPDAGFILIVEDDVSTANLMAVLLRMEGYECEVADDCDEAIAVTKRRKPALVLLDYLLKGETCEKIITEGRIDGAPVVLVSAWQEAGKVFDRLHLSGFIKKPFDIESLTDLVKTI